MRNALSQLASLSTAPDVTVCLKHWQWSDDIAKAVTAALPTLTHLKLTVNLQDRMMTDALLGMALQLGANMPSLNVGAFDLESDQYANTPWPWEGLTIDMLDIADLCKLPMPTGDGDTRVRVKFRAFGFYSLISQVRNQTCMS